MTKTISEILFAAADLIAKPGAWTQGAFARTSNGTQVGSTHPEAVCWCAAGAINRAAFDANSRVNDAHIVFEGVVGGFEFTWNDSFFRKQAEVVAKLREAAEKAREQGQ